MRVIRNTLIALSVAVAFGFGCSKKTASAPEASGTDAAGASANAKAPAAADEAMVAAALEELNRRVAQQQYDAAVGSIVSMSQLPKTPAQEAQYRAKFRQTETELLKRAQAGDPNARQSAQMLGTMMTGR